MHSVFGHSFNIKVNDQLLHVSSYSEYLSSFGIHIEEALLQEILQQIEVGNFTKIARDKIQIYSRSGVLTIDLAAAKTRSLNLPRLHWNSEKNTQLLQKIAEEELSKAIGLEIDDKTQQQIDWLTQRDSLSREEIREICQYLIGRGKGLTPSGDDLLVAYLATLIAFEDKLAEDMIQVLSEIPISTTDVSKAYLNGVLAGHVSSPILRFFQAIQTNQSIAEIQQQFQNILKIGHTSGKDMGYGIYLAFQYLEKK